MSTEQRCPSRSEFGSHCDFLEGHDGLHQHVDRQGNDERWSSSPDWEMLLRDVASYLSMSPYEADKNWAEHIEAKLGGGR